MNMQLFLSALMGSLVGGVMLAVASLIGLYIQQRMASKRANRLVDEFKNNYYSKLANMANQSNRAS